MVHVAIMHAVLCAVTASMQHAGWLPHVLLGLLYCVVKTNRGHAAVQEYIDLEIDNFRNNLIRVSCSMMS